MSLVTEGRHAGAFLLSEECGYSRDAVTILAGEGVLPPGTVIGKIMPATGAVTVTKGATVGTGNGVLTLADPAYGAGVKAGAYRVVFIEPATDLGSFVVEDPDGIVVGTGVVGTAFTGVVKFTIADGSTDFVAGATIPLTVAIADPANVGKWRSADPTNTDGSGVARGVIVHGVDATSVDVEVAAVVRLAEVKTASLTFDAAVDTAPEKATKLAELAAAGIIGR